MRPDEGERTLPALSPDARAAALRSRELLVTGELLEHPPGRLGVRTEIERSWRRCVGAQVPVVPERIEYHKLDDVPMLRDAALPVLQRVKDSFADVPVALVLSDVNGVIVARHVDVRRQREIMDRASAAEGFDYSESSVGTNGLGTVLVERRPMLVRGPEHYNVRLETLTCAGAPIVEPYTGRLVGAFSLACEVHEVHPLMLVMAADIARQIEERLLDMAGERHRRLVHAYLAVDRTGAGAFVVDADTVLANRRALAHTGPELHPLLWRFLSEHGPSSPTRMQVPLPDGPHAALVEPIRDSGRTAYLVQLLGRRSARCDEPVEPPRSPARRAPVRVPLHVDEDVDRELEAALHHGELIAVVGAGGTGKLHTALAVLRRLGAEDPVVVEPHLDPDWFATAREAAGSGRGLVLRRVHESPSPSLSQVQALVATGAPMVLTADLDAASDDVLATVRRVATTVTLPGLAQKPEHLPTLVQAILRELPEPESATRFAPQVWDRLMAWRWPGNVAELRNTVVQLARRARGGTVELTDLPDLLRIARGSHGLLECAEREAVADALRAAGGNRSRAAAALGIGRNTLYRKMRAFGLT
ncbi:regulatory protein, Fis family [Pseudonocardia thermophila]|jgi:Transcriptional activator of acetoin/glycerol metabolism|uniref:Regulatory protein, Fis family n=1 Tax=Pseudonocardia thermophila TaxID=1848 RepID=A0A1M6UFK8_PSETH|nr:helix-turn-helix domain-containing protein [Pseudonocardia thermophila]SHK67960.1 regulatory protein, Fis family [Pseudonocardia thermophila]